MRCPKCGYISFDHLERCKKCGKDIVEAMVGLDGTVFDAVAPAFLKFVEEPAGEGAMAEEAGEHDLNLDLDDTFDAAETEMEVNLDEEVELVLDDEEQGDVQGGGDLEAALAGLGDDTAGEPTDLSDTGEESEPLLALGGDQEGESGEIEGLQLDFGDIDISDLAPPDEENDETEELTLDSVDKGPPVMASGSAPVAGMTPGGLEDLEIDGLDLDSPPPVAGSAAGGRLPPAVKTGTALDDFDIDLGELLSEKKSEKA